MSPSTSPSSGHLVDVPYPCSHCAKEGLKRLGLYTNTKQEKVCDFHRHNPIGDSTK